MANQTNLRSLRKRPIQSRPVICQEPEAASLSTRMVELPPGSHPKILAFDPSLLHFGLRELSEDVVISLKVSESMAKLASDAKYVRTAVNNNLNHQAMNMSQVRPREGLKSVQGRSKCIETPTQSATSRDRGMKAARKLRRSNSCSDIVRMNKPGSRLKPIG